MNGKAIAVLLAVGALALSLTVLAHLSGYASFNAPVAVVFVALAFGLFMLLRAVLGDWLAERMVGGKAWALLSVSILAGIAIQQVQPLRSDVFPRAVELRLTNTGQRNVDSKGNEIWAKLVSAKGAPIKPKQPVPAGWELKDDGTVMSAQAGAEPVIWRVKLDSGASLSFTRHGWSGIAETQWVGQSRQLDLYAGEGAQPERMALEGRPVPSGFDRAVTLAVAIADAATLALLVLLLLLQFAARPRDN